MFGRLVSLTARSFCPTIRRMAAPVSTQIRSLAFAPKVVVAPNAFKECLDAKDVAEFIAKGVLQAIPDANVVHVPLGDGGDGTFQLLVDHSKGEVVEMDVVDPLFRKVKGQYGLIRTDNKLCAVIEMANPSGLWRLQPPEQDALKTCSVGFGQMMQDALDKGAQRLLLCIGGSATNDGGIGMASALGYRFFDADDKQIPQTELVGGHLKSIARIDSSCVHPRLKSGEVEVVVACDVDNPLLGPKGATRVYGPQKGARTEAALKHLEEGLACISGLWQSGENLLGPADVNLKTLAGAGAAGGMGAALLAFCGAKLRPGFDLVAEQVALPAALRGADFVITGEGGINESTVNGKVPFGVAQFALRAAAEEKKPPVPVVALAGGIAGNLTALLDSGVTSVFALARGPTTLKASMENAGPLLHNAAHQATRLWALAAKQRF